MKIHGVTIGLVWHRLKRDVRGRKDVLGILLGLRDGSLLLDCFSRSGNFKEL